MRFGHHRRRLACQKRIDANGNETIVSDCRSCACGDSKYYGEHVDNLGKCGNCGQSLE